MLHTEVTTSVTRSRTAVAEAANRSGELPRRIQFRRKFRIPWRTPSAPGAPRRRESNGRKVEELQILTAWLREPPACEVCADLGADCRQRIRSYNTSAPNREVDRR